MKNNFTFILMWLLCIFSLNTRAQTSTEQFETESNGSSSFTDNGVIFNIISNVNTYDIQAAYPGTGWNGTAADNRYIDNSGAGGQSAGTSFSIKTTSNLFKVNRFWVYAAAANTTLGVAGTLTITGKLSGVTKFTQTKTTGFTATTGTANGYTLIDLTNLNGQNYSNIVIDQLQITAGGNFQYLGVDAFTWVKDAGVVAGVNTSPTDISLSAAAINENVAANSTVGTLSSTDADSGNTFTYALVSGTGDTDNSSFSISGNSLIINASPDFETKSSYSIRLRTTDQGNLTFEKQFTININDLAEGVLLSSSPTLSFTTNSTDITSDNIASDGEGGSQAISDIDIKIYNISDTDGTFTTPLSWQNNSWLGSSNSSYSAITNPNNGGSKGMAIKSADGSEFKLFDFKYYNWGETSSSLTNTIKGYRNGSEVASMTFEGYDSSYIPQTVTLTSAFSNVDEVRFYISAGGYKGDQSATNHSVNSIKVGSPVITCTNPVVTGNPSNQSICVNGNTTFTASATGATAYQWQVNTGSGFTDITNGGVYSNATTSTLTITGATAGMNGYLYRCVAKDGSCNTTSSAATLTVSNPSVTASSQTNIACNGGATGAASVNPATGGVGPYTYNWTPGNPTGDGTTSVTGLTAGTWTCTVTDANACTTSVNFTITQPTALVATAASQTNVSCNGGSNGTATVAPTGGTPAYTYSWAPSGGTAATATGLSAGNYTVTVTDANGCIATKLFTITQPTAISFTTTSLPGYDYNTSYSQNVVATGGTGSITYAVTSGSLPAGFTLSPAGVISGTSTQVADSNFTVTATDVNSCTATYNFILKLNQIPITVTADASQTKVYGSSNPVLTYTVTPALLSGDSFTGSLSRAAGENVGSYVINQGTLSAGNKYLITYVSKNFAITAKPITVTANVSQTKVYGTTDPTFTYSVSPSLVSGDSFTGSLTRAAGENIGTYAINQGSLSAGSNYTISYVSKDFAITAKPITVTANVSQTKVYGTANPVYTYTVSPSLISGDSFTGALSRVTGENVGTYAIQQGSLSAGSNYTISYVSKDFTITAKPITVTANVSQTKVYGTANPVYTYTVSPNLISGDSFTGALSRVTGENVGTYAIQQGSLSAGSNYTISYVSKDFAITAKPITVTVNASQTKVYGTSDPVFTYTVSPSLITGDSFTGALSRATGEDVGTYAIAQGSLTAGTNYLISYVGANFSITKANQTISWNQILELGCDSGSSKNLTATASSGLPVSYVSSNTNIATISNGVLTVHDYGFTTLTASQAGNNNYFPATVVVLTVTNSQPNLIRKQFEDIIFFDNSSKQFVSYTWYKDGVLVSGQTSQFYKENGALNGIYYAKATRLDGMVVTSCPLILSPTIEDEYIKIAPNPVKSNASYELLTNVSSSKLQNAHVEVYSVGGMLMQNVVTSQNTVKLTAPVVEGLYIVKMTLSNGKIFTKNLLVKN